MGEWRRAELSYLRANRTHCDLCGQPIAGRYWSAEVEGEERVFCRAEHEQRYVSYWLPLHGRGAEAR